MNEQLCYCNNRFLSLNEAAISVSDLGYQRGYGIFDFLRTDGNRALYIDDHLDRFYRSATEMRLPLRQTRGEIKEIIAELISGNRFPYSGIRIMLSGGASPDGYQIGEPALVIVQSPLTPPPDHIPSPYTLVSYHHQRQMPHVKTTDYLMAVWLQPWVKAQGADDVLYHNSGSLSELPRSNFFLVTDDDTIVTPAENILKGITRKQVLTLAVQAGLRVEERTISIDEIRTAKGAFISSSTKRIIPVGQVDGHVFGERNGLAGRLFRLLLEYERSGMASEAFQ